MEDWTRSDILTTITIIVGIVAIVASVMAARRWGTKKAKIAIDYEFTSLLAEGKTSDLVKVTYRDVDVPEPHLLRISIANIGPRDVKTTDFDAKEPLTIHTNCVMYGPIGSTDYNQKFKFETEAIGASGQVKIPPQLIKSGMTWEFEAIVSGSAAPEYSSPLIDTDIIFEEASERRATRERQLRFLETFVRQVLPLPFLGLFASKESAAVNLMAKKIRKVKKN